MTVNEVLGSALDNAIRNPRTTISGILTALIGLIPTLLASGIIHGKAATISLSVVTVSKIILSSFFQKDAGQVAAIVPGQPEPVMVPSHEIPDSPNAIPVVPAPNAKP